MIGLLKGYILGSVWEVVLSTTKEIDGFSDCFLEKKRLGYWASKKYREVNA